MLATDTTHRVLVVDDNQAIHDDFRKILSAGAERPDLDSMEQLLFGGETERKPPTSFAVDSALQGRAALDLVIEARAAQQPYAVAFVDMRMPPGWDGAETIEQLWRVDPELQVVICSAYSDYSWDSLRERFGERDGLLVIKKPFDPIEVVQCVHALTTKWRLARMTRGQMADLEAEIEQRKGELAAANQAIRFCRDGVVDLVNLVGDLRVALDSPHPPAGLRTQLVNALAQLDDRIQRVASIVRWLE